MRRAIALGAFVATAVAIVTLAGGSEPDRKGGGPPPPAERTRGGLPLPEQVAICGGYETGKENVVDEFDSNVQLDAVSRVAHSIFGARDGQRWIDRADCPAVLRVLATDVTPADRSEFAEAVEALPRTDPELVILEEVDYSWDELLAAKEAVARVIPDHVRTWAVAPNNVDQWIEVDLPRPDAEVMEAARAATDVPLHFSFCDGSCGGFLF